MVKMLFLHGKFKKKSFMHTFFVHFLTITLTDIFYKIGTISYAIFDFMKVLGHIPNVVIWLIIIVLLAYWTIQINKQTKQAKQNGTLI